MKYKCHYEKESNCIVIQCSSGNFTDEDTFNTAFEWKPDPEVIAMLITSYMTSLERLIKEMK